MAIKKTTSVVKPKFKPYVGDMTFRLGPLSFRGAMVAVRKPKASTKVTYKLVSPENDNPVEQRYIDTVTKKAYADAECKRKFDDVGEVAVLDIDTATKLRQSQLPNNVLTITVHPKDEVDEALWWSDANGYLLFPDTKDPQNKELVEAFVAAVQTSTDKAFLGVCSFRGNEGLFRLSIWRNQLIMHKILYPEEMQDHDFPPAPEVTADVNMIKAFFDKRVEAFNSEAYIDNVTRRQREVLANPEILDIETDVPSASSLSDLLSSLEEWG